MNGKHSGRALAALLALVLTTSATSQAQAAPAGSGVVDRVVDGDTIVMTIDGASEKVRFLNVDTPEVGRCMAGDATKYTQRQVPVAAEAALTYDRDLRDDYGRLLAMVTGTDGRWVSVGLAESGLGFPMSVRPNSTHYDAVVGAAGRAKRARVGMFSPTRSCTPIARATRAERMANEAARMPVRNRAQFRAVNRRLDAALGAIALVAASQYRIKSPWFSSYLRSLSSPVRKRVATVRGAKLRQWNAVRNNDDDSDDDGGSNGWWPPGVPHNYNGPRCYQPGGVVWYPC